MRKDLLLIFLATSLIGCDRLPAGMGRPATALRDEEFVELYVKLAKTRSPEEKGRILKEAGTTPKEMEEFVRVRLNDLPALSLVFDSVVARLGNPADDGLRHLPRR